MFGVSMKLNCFKGLAMLLFLFLMVSGCKGTEAITEYYMGALTHGGNYYLPGFESRWIESRMEEPELYDLIFHGKVISVGEITKGSVLAEGVSLGYIEETGEILYGDEEIYKAEKQCVNYQMDYQLLTIEVIECVKGDLQPGEQIQTANTWLEEYYHSENQRPRQVGSEEIFCIDLERVSDTTTEVSARRVITWRLDGYPVLEGKALNGYRFLIEDGEVLLDWAVPTDSKIFQPTQKVPVSEYLASLRGKIAEREDELKAYRQTMLEAPRVTYEIIMDYSGQSNQSKVPIVYFDCSTSADGAVDYLAERKNPDGSYRRIYNYGDPVDAYVEPGKTYTYRICTVGMEFWALSELPMSEPTYVTITIPEE